MAGKINVSANSRKCDDATKLTAGSTRTPIEGAHVVAVNEEFFFAHMTKVAGFINKELVADLRVSPTLVDMWKSGERIDPFTRAQEGIESFRRKGRSDLIPTILIYIAGGFDGAVLTAEQFEALKVLTKVVKE